MALEETFAREDEADDAAEERAETLEAAAQEKKREEELAEVERAVKAGKPVPARPGGMYFWERVYFAAKDLFQGRPTKE